MKGTIYYLTDQNNIPKYVGQTTKKLNIRLAQHLVDKNNKYKTKWISDIGKENIKIIKIEECDIELLDEKERYWIDVFTFLNYELTNCTNGGVLGYTYSDEIKQKISSSEKGKIVSEETKKKLSESHRGKKQSIESIKKRSESNRGKKRKEGFFSGESNPFYNKKHSEESKKKMSESAKGRKISEETKKKISEMVSNYWKLKKQNT